MPFMQSISENLKTISGKISDFSGIHPETQQKLLVTIILIVLFMATHYLIVLLLKKHIVDKKKIIIMKRLSNYIVILILIFFIAQIWYSGNFSLGTFLGLLSAALAFVMKDIMMNIAGWVYIIWRKPFRIGDRIEINGIKGDVIDMRLMAFMLAECAKIATTFEQSTGKVVHIPNSFVLTHPLSNSTLGFNYVWDEIPIVITFESNWKKAKKHFFDIMNRHTQLFTSDAEEQIKQASQEFLILYKNLNPTVYTNVLDSGIQITLRYLIKARRRREMQEKIWEDVLSALAVNPDIELAYPTIRYYDRKQEQ